MEIPRCQKAALEQVDRFWSLLDDMSQNDPGAYETFLKRQLRDGCGVNVSKLSQMFPNILILYVNVCGWGRVPAPASPTQPVPGQGPARAGLVTVMSSTEAARCPQPRHQLTVCPETSTRTLRLRVDLPGVHAVSQCQLSITQVDVLLEVEDMYYLHLWFPEAVNENTCCATYNKKKHTLTVTVCVL
uniref:PIH1 domain containing 2 n=1 Tax=Electrophorus electricus TaxID=8005 RepID=A0A4W4GBB9_ELEEL